VIQNCSAKDAGKYTAVVENEMGSIEGACFVEFAGDSSAHIEIEQK